MLATWLSTPIFSKLCTFFSQFASLYSEEVDRVFCSLGKCASLRKVQKAHIFLLKIIFLEMSDEK